MTRPVRPIPKLAAFRVMNGGVEQLGAWCPWCETTHWHGAAGGGGNRAPHCGLDPSSPMRRTGYDLEVIGDAPRASAIGPVGLMVGDHRLHQVMDQAAGAIRAVVLRWLLGIKAVRGSVVQKRGRQGSAWIFGCDRWLVEQRGRPACEGSGFLSLAAALYGVPPGVVAVRFLEAASFDRLDEQAAFELADVIDRWHARSSPRRPAR